ncbi:UDP-N-acetyl-D-mannosaminuronic acid transferase [Picosynechococcus sp. PCC 7003]|uniref:WecB/TagA/CpsF family glycosyltransferase n=1 Tax=Picosynechococcus sp. PCC 7003 TaxID=374981 RepID=UPI0008105A70|nr:WecB/TagA/CpsF family glycosyltransferase [Picosynechococcus sp. PCC 7003]ANV83140.1 UDP-N-acetyl-D-mannosaminuronic acid transferase [Picosynechococcus sp. PCC 7003]
MALTTDIPQRHILKTRVHCLDYQRAWAEIAAAIRDGTFGYGAIANVHMVMTGYWQPEFQHIINQALVTTPDGMPLVWGLRWLGYPQATRVYGPDLMLHCCAMAAQEKIPVYLYGSRPETLEKLQQTLLEKFPNLQIAGVEAPPFRSPTPAEAIATRQRIEQSGAKLVFVGLGCPKQEKWMAENSPHLAAVLLGVGAAFDFHAGTVSQAPRWLMTLGLEWLYRLIQEPRRLWKRYLVHNGAFIFLFGWQLLRRRSP